MSFERHTRGKIYGQVEICRSSYLSKQSFAGERADIWNSEVLDSYVKADARVRQSVIEKLSRIEGGEIYCSQVVGSRVTGGRICGAYVENSLVEGGYLKGDIARGGVRVVSSVIKDFAVVEMTASVEGVTLEKSMRVGYGHWTRPPRYFEITNEIADIAVSESVDGHAFILCRHKKMTDWIKARKRLQRAVRWPDEMIEEIKEHFENWLDNPLPTYGL